MLSASLSFSQSKLLRNPDISENHVVFEYAQDIWVAEAGGGKAFRLSSEPGNEMYPHISPDGRWVAFTGEYGGNLDVYVVAIDGGQPKRLTWHPGNDNVTGWTADSKSVTFSSNRETPHGGWYQIFTIALDASWPEKLPAPRAVEGELSPDGSHLAYVINTRWDPGWRNYRGGQNRPIRILELSTLEETDIPFDGTFEKSPVWVGSDIFFISDRNLTSNVYKYSTVNKQVEQITNFVEYDVMSIGAGDGKVVFEQAGELHVYNPSNGSTQTLSVDVQGDFPWALPQWKEVSDLIMSGSVSPTGKRALIEARGEVFAVPAENGSTINYSRNSGAADRFPTWSPDGKYVAWFSDRSGEYQLALSDADQSDTRFIDLDGGGFYFTPEWSPDSKYLSYTDADLNVWICEISTGKQTKVDTDMWAQPARTIEPVWSPDSKWLAYAKRMENQYHAVVIYSLESGKTHQVTDALSDALEPSWDKSGKYLWFLASTNVGPGTTGWLDMSSYNHPQDYGLYAAVLSKTTADPLAPESDMEAITVSEKPEPKKKKGLFGNKKDDEEEKAPELVVNIDFEGLNQRIVAVNIPVRAYTALEAGAEHTVFLTESIPNQRGLTLHRYDLKKKKATEFMSGVSIFDVSADGKKLMYGAGSTYGIVDAGGTAKVGDGKISLAGLKMKLDPAAEWEQLLKESWRLQRDFFYVPNYHGADIDAVWKRYSVFLPHVKHRADLAYLMDMLGAEYSVGHSYTRSGDEPGPDRVSVGLLGADWKQTKAGYAISRIYTAESWNPDLDAPLAKPGISVRSGDILKSVNGIDVSADKNLYSYFENLAGELVTLTFTDQNGANERTFMASAISSERGLRSRTWVEDNRRKVEDLSDGKLAYVWLPNTAGAGYTYFNRYYFAQQDKMGAVIDERWNGGGSAADYIVDILGRNLHGYFNNPVHERKPFPSPGAGIWGPKVMVVNEMAGSGGDYLPFMFRKEGLGKLVGVKTWGGLVGIWDTQQLIDGGLITNPRGGFFNMDGEWDVENKGIAPDVVVDIDAKSFAEGKDLQLEKAVEVALQELENNPPRILTKEPPPPIRSVRPKQ